MITCEYFPQTVLFLRSLDTFFPEHPIVLIHHYGLSTRQKRYLQRFTEVTLISIATMTDHSGPIAEVLKDTNLDPAIFYERFRFFGEEYNDYETILFLDVDMVALQPFAELFSHSTPFFVADAALTPWAAFKDSKDPQFKALLASDGLALGPQGVNAGMCVLPRKVRSATQLTELQNFAERYAPYLRQADQSVLTLWSYAHDIPLSEDFRYNYQASLMLYYRSASLSTVKLLHWAGIRQGSIQLLLSWLAIKYAIARDKQQRRAKMYQKGIFFLLRSPIIARLLGHGYAQALRLKLMARF